MKKILAASAAALALSSMTPAIAQSIKITPNGATPSVVGASDYFTGHAVIDSLYPATDETRATTGVVTFAPGARTAWHTHPAGQLLIVTSGQGWIREEGQPKRVINPGDVIWIPVGIKHWHGATATNQMSHIAVSYMRDGKNVEWLEQVTDEQYGAK